MYVDKILAFFEHLPLYVDIFYLIIVDKKSTFSEYLPTFNVVKECPLRKKKWTIYKTTTLMHICNVGTMG